MSIHTGRKILATIGNLIQGEVKTKARGIHHYYREMIQDIIDVYEDHCKLREELIEALTDKSLKYHQPTIKLPRGINLPKRSLLSRYSLYKDPEENPETVPVVETKENTTKPSIDSQGFFKQRILLVNRKSEFLESLQPEKINSNPDSEDRNPVIVSPEVDNHYIAVDNRKPVTYNSKPEGDNRKTVEEKYKPVVVKGDNCKLEVDNSKTVVNRKTVVDNRKTQIVHNDENKLTVNVKPVIKHKHLYEQKPLIKRNEVRMILKSRNVRREDLAMKTRGVVDP